MYMCVTIISAGIANQMCHRCVIIHVLLCSHDSSCMSSLSRHYLLETDYSHLVCPGIIVSVMIVQFIGPTPDMVVHVMVFNVLNRLLPYNSPL